MKRALLSLPIFCLLTLACVAPAARGQVGPAEVPRTGDTAGADGDRDWQGLRPDLPRPPVMVVSAGSEGAAAQATAALARADRFKAFYMAHPEHDAAAAAKKEEAIALLDAAAAGDESQAERRATLVAEVRRDEAIPAVERSAVAAYAGNLAVRLQKGLTRQQRRMAYEQVVRGLIAEFPDVPDAYESLLNLSRSQGREHGAAAAREILGMSPPESIRRLAEAYLTRMAGTTPVNSREKAAGSAGPATNPER